MNYLKHLGALENKFRLLDELPDELYGIIVTHSHGELNLRIQGILQWREAFLKGHLPEEEFLLWPDASPRRTVLKRLEVLDIVRYCKDQPELTDAILKDVCEAITSAEHWQEIDPGFDDTLARQQKQRDKGSPFRDADNQNNGAQDNPSEPSEEVSEQNINTEEETTQEAIAQDSVLSAAQLDIGQDNFSLMPDGGYENSSLEQRWQALAQQWRELEPVFSELSGFLGRGWDLTQGLLASQGWQDIIRYRQLVKDLPWLEQVIAALGRLKEKTSDEQDAIIEQVFEPIKHLVDEEVEVRTPHAVYETSGIRRSDDISRLLPGELAQLGHPRLNLLWHAKRAEHTLLTYQIYGVLSEHEPVEQEELQEITKTRPESEKGYGPIIICLDSSASMQGEPENIAKALVLEALKIAWQEHRACYVYLFSGPEQLLQHNLDLAKGGLAELLSFLTHTFHGGTDIVGPLVQALAQQKQQNWQAADVLLVTDGRFPISHEQKQQIRTMRKQSQSRIHGVVVGNWQGAGMHDICDNFHRITKQN